MPKSYWHSSTPQFFAYIELFLCGTKGCVELRGFWCGTEGGVELSGLLKRGVSGVELRDFGCRNVLN